ncbi:MAG TPA: hypothetical protein VGC17_02465 [Lactovum miscens]|uniref:hypothetical protein n=1 Tax=Lactovum miscens TaxID=190387 RepID=UPI002EDB8288
MENDAEMPINLGIQKAMFKIFNNESEWDIFQNFIKVDRLSYVKSKKELELLKKVKSASWTDNTENRPDFLSDDIMIEMFEIDDIVTTKKGRNHPQREADARALRNVQNKFKWAKDVPKIIVHGDPRNNPGKKGIPSEKSKIDHNYEAYVNNFTRICEKHLNSLKSYKNNYPDKKLGFLIIDGSSMYLPKYKLPYVSMKDAFFCLPFYDKNLMKLIVKSNVDFIIWAFDNKYIHTEDDLRGQNSVLPDVVLITKDNYYKKKYSKYFDVNTMISLEK